MSLLTRLSGSIFAIALGAMLLPLLRLPLWAAEPVPTVYVCPACESDCDNLTFDHPGVCPHCGMTLVPQVSGHTQTVAILLFNGVQIIDYSGPWEVFGEAGYRVFTVAETVAPIRTVFGQVVIPAYSFATAPKADILLIPGGDVGDALCNDQALIHWVQAESASSSHVLSVCTGAFIMAKAGLLDGLTATTFHGAIDQLALKAPKTKVVSDLRYVDNGKIVVTAGLSSGIDGALHLVSAIEGLGVAQSVALNAEYDWKPASTYARAALADRNLRFKSPDLGGKILSQEGDRDHWKIVWQVDRQGSVAEFTVKTDKILASQTGWTQISPTTWSFADSMGAAWHARTVVTSASNNSTKLIWMLEIAKNS
jgi:putative intracellular protease/amidase/DNA-directed RNA polymerase subunit RPC12/RpoP